MSTQRETAPSPGAVTQVSNRQPQDTTETQFHRTISMMMDCDEVCSSEFYRAYLPRFSVHIHRARKLGYVISKRQCDRSDHDHRGTQWLYELVALPELFPQGSSGA